MTLDQRYDRLFKDMIAEPERYKIVSTGGGILIEGPTVLLGKSSHRTLSVINSGGLAVDIPCGWWTTMDKAIQTVEEHYRQQTVKAFLGQRLA